MRKQWTAESLRSFEQMAARRQERFEALWSSLSSPSRWAPPEWAPKSAAGKEQYALGYERLAKEPALFAFGWDVRARLGDGDFGQAGAVDEELCDWAWRQAPRLLAVPASSLWRLAGKERWRSFCAQAAGLSEERLRRAILEFAQPLGLGFHDQIAREWASEGAGSRLSSQATVDKQHEGGFLAGLAIALNPGRLLDQQPARPGESDSQRAQRARDRLDLALAQASQRLASELGGGWDLPSPQGEGLTPARPFAYAWRESTEQREIADRLCLSAWEAGEIERGLGAQEPAAAKPRARL